MLAIVNIAKSTKFASKPAPTFISFDLVFPLVHSLPPGRVDSTSLRLTNPFLSYVSFIFIIKFVVK